MCLLCVEYQRGNLTIVKKNWAELYSDDKNKEHLEELYEKIIEEQIQQEFLQANHKKTS